MREKREDGTWVEPFDEFAWGGPYCESGPWQASWFVPHDPAGLTGLLGGREQFAAKLDKLFSLPPTYHEGGFKRVIHEMKEMEAIPFGQCSLNNQPSFSIPYLYAAIGQPWKTQYWTRRACDEFFDSGPQGFCGDEDNGSLASWYILSAIGLYPFCPGTSQYIVTSPLFHKVTIQLAEEKMLVISAPANSDKNVYVQKRELNGKEDARTWVSHQELIGGGEIRFEMGSTPKTESVMGSALPYSASLLP
jgi:predicted alpha-1,2-mannosidase